MTWAIVIFLFQEVNQNYIVMYSVKGTFLSTKCWNLPHLYVFHAKWYHFIDRIWTIFSIFSASPNSICINSICFICLKSPTENSEYCQINYNHPVIFVLISRSTICQTFAFTFQEILKLLILYFVTSVYFRMNRMIQIPVDFEHLYKYAKKYQQYFSVQYFKRDFKFLTYN